MNKRDTIRIPARILLWLGGMICGLSIQHPVPWTLTLAFLATLSGLLALQHLDREPSSDR